MSKEKRIICTVSGGKASAWCADWTLKTYPTENIVLYFNDTHWEHPDLYRFLKDLTSYWQKIYNNPALGIFVDSDDSTPEDVFYDTTILGSNNKPICSKVLKAERLQKFFEDGDTLIFGIGPEERQRMDRIINVYEKVRQTKKKSPILRFPLIETQTSSQKIDEWLKSTGVKQPHLYDIGASHNNCFCGCVRQGMKQWLLCLEKLPDVYAKREKLEEDFRNHTKKDVHFLKEMTLKNLRQKYEAGKVIVDKDEPFDGECIGVCDIQN